MKTPEEIKRGLKRCTDVCYGHCKECAYGENDPSECVLKLSEDALAYIIRLEAERDAAVEELRVMGSCINCKYSEEMSECEACRN